MSAAKFDAECDYGLINGSRLLRFREHATFNICLIIQKCKGAHENDVSSFSVVVITLDFESSNGGSNPSGRFSSMVRSYAQYLSDPFFDEDSDFRLYFG